MCVYICYCIGKRGLFVIVYMYFGVSYMYHLLAHSVVSLHCVLLIFLFVCCLFADALFCALCFVYFIYCVYCVLINLVPFSF